MKKNILMLMAAGLFCLAACNDILEVPEITQPEEPASSGKMITETITAKVDFGGTKAGIGADGTFSWTQGDLVAIHVYNENSSPAYKYVVSSGASAFGDSASFAVSYEAPYARNAFAVYPSSIVPNTVTGGLYGIGHPLDLVMPASYALDSISGEKSPCPMIATNNPNSPKWRFKQLCGLLRLTVSGIPSTASYLKLYFNGVAVSGDFQVAVSGTDVVPGTSTLKLKESVRDQDQYITITNLPASVGTVTFNIPLPTTESVSYQDIVVSAWDAEDHALKAEIIPFTHSVARAQGIKMSISLTSYAFSCGKSGNTPLYCLIAPGNLKYSNGTFSFHTHQYDRCFTTDVYDGSDGLKAERTANYTSSGTFDLFGFGTSGYNYCYAWLQDNDDSKYAPGHLSTSTYSQYDWGIYNPIGSYSKKIWCTPTHDEMNALRWGGATVIGIKGRIIIPELFVDPMKNNGSGAFIEYINNNCPSSTDTNVYDADGWAAMENAGAAFLPFTGEDVYSHYINKQGDYWTATSYSSNAAYLYRVGSINDDCHTERHKSKAVRLIHRLR
jgi:hypothetical protein